MQRGDEIVIKPDELVAGGNALARLDGLPIFASNVFPGDVALVRVTEVKRGFARAELVRLLSSSPLRRLGPCPVAEECGGCDWTALRLDAQLDAKRRILSESLRRIGKFDPASLPPITIHPSPLNYRIRSRLQRDDDAIGFYALRSNRVVQLPRECEVVGLETARCFGGAPPTRRRTTAAEVGGAPLTGAPTIWELQGELIHDSELSITVDEFTWRLSTASFFQVNRHLLSTMLRLVSAHAARVEQRTLALDLYAGVGFFTLPLAKLFDQVIAVEGSPESAKYTRINAPSNVRILEKPVEQARLPEADLIFLDPPRAGARKEVMAAAGQRARAMICHLSCDPVTFARDANRLIASGWRLRTLDLLDLFPNTHHVETLSSFERAR
ncbi:MAG TPA: TRAM domain-containing protein [Thermoanaerobaculia bacterium]|nr:TRAM domain-containing protein [Thermoanaerobaculia bacterium]